MFSCNNNFTKKKSPIMKNLVYVLSCVVLIAAASCRKDFSTVLSSGKLEFSKDTVFLDTIFTNISSATYNLRVYNKNNRAITIPKISLEKGSNSNYRLNVDGIPGKSFESIDILAKDSIFIFVETTVDITNQASPLYTDKILFDTGILQQSVNLVTLIEDANFIFPGRNAISMKIDSLSLDGKPTSIKGRFLKDDELTFTKVKPTVIYGYAAVPENKTLTIEAGAKIYFHDSSGLIVDKKASLKVNGTLAEKVIFEGDRLENSFSNITGQWGTIWMRAGSLENEINHAKIKNGIIGILIDSIGHATSPTLKIANTEIYNHANFGILARQTNIEGYNLVIGSAGQASLAATIGGTYNFTHCTFANFWNNGIRPLPAVLVNNFFTSEQNGQTIVTATNLKEASFTNCIFEGNNSFELLFDKVEGAIFNFNVSNSLVKFNPTDTEITEIPEMDFTKSNHYQAIIKNGTADFRNSILNDFVIGSKSNAIEKAKSTIYNIDILGVDRSSNPDVGAYQHIDFN